MQQLDPKQVKGLDSSLTKLGGLANIKNIGRSLELTEDGTLNSLGSGIGSGLYLGYGQNDDGAITQKGATNLFVHTAPDGTNNLIENNKIKSTYVPNNTIKSGSPASTEAVTSWVTTAMLNNGAVTTDKITDSNVTSGKIASGAVTEGKIAASAVTSDKIADGAITTAKIADGNITNGKIIDGAITTTKITDNAVTADKINLSSIFYTKTLSGTINIGTTATTIASFTNLPEGTYLVILNAAIASASAGGTINFSCGELSRGYNTSNNFWSNVTPIFVTQSSGTLTVTATAENAGSSIRAWLSDIIAIRVA